MISALTAFIFLAVTTSVLSLFYGVEAVLKPIRMAKEAVTVVGGSVSALGSKIGERIALSIHPAETSPSKLRGPRWA
jgi:hypothetical protein